MLTADQIHENWQQLLNVIKTEIPGERSEQLLSFYQKYSDRIMLMPASYKKEYHNCFPGGYVDHVLRVIQCAQKLHNVWVEMGVDTSTYTYEELIFSALNHDLGKIGDENNESYIPQTDQWRKDKLGENYKFNDKLEFISVPDRSLYLLLSNNIMFSKNEMLAIKLHDGVYDEANKPYLQSWLPETKPRTSLIYIIHHADMMASRLEFEREWLPKFRRENNTSAGNKNFSLESQTSVKKDLPQKARALNTVKSEGLKNLLDSI